MPSIDRYVTPLCVPMPIDLFWRLPKQSGYAAEYKADAAQFTYRPRWSMGRLRVPAPVRSTETALTRRDDPPLGSVSNGSVQIRPLDPAASHDALARLFVEAFGHVAPLDTMAATTRRHAADAALRHTASGGDGAVFAPACLAAMIGRRLIGAALVTHITLRADEWPEPSAPSPMPNLTWLFVSPDLHRSGIGTRLLSGVMSALSTHGFPWLVSHVPHDNASAMLFHWRRGFELVPCRPLPALSSDAAAPA